MIIHKLALYKKRKIIDVVSVQTCRLRSAGFFGFIFMKKGGVS